jgi:hypothetical protein
MNSWDDISSEFLFGIMDIWVTQYGSLWCRCSFDLMLGDPVFFCCDESLDRSHRHPQRGSGNQIATRVDLYRECSSWWANESIGSEHSPTILKGENISTHISLFSQIYLYNNHIFRHQSLYV